MKNGMSRSRSRRERESPVLKWARRLSERTHPAVPLLVMLGGLLVLFAIVFMIFGVFTGPIVILVLAIVIASVLELRDQLEMRGWL